jgi:DNA-directed RNA polymerase subunit RPC12/RpoP
MNTSFDFPLDAAAGPAGPVTCLGLTFPDDAARRAHFTRLLRDKLRDSQFRAAEGFPLADDEAILALSDPPYYTACPNPWTADFVAEWQAHKPPPFHDGHYRREPFAADVSEGKNDPIYNAHSYHTKVPHKAIMRYLLHYTEPGDVVFDGFCGTGMTGVAAQLCGDADEVRALGYRVDADGVIAQRDESADGAGAWTPFARLGARRAVLNDLSPAATFIAYNYNTPVDAASFEREAQRILGAVEAECGWMYETAHTDGRTGRIHYTVWSDVFVCASCGGEVVFWDAAVDHEAKQVRDEFACPHCAARLKKRGLERAFTQRWDPALRSVVRQSRQTPVLINYAVGKTRYEKKPDAADLAAIARVEAGEIPHWFPTDPMMGKGEGWGDTWRSGIHAGITHVHHFYTRRNLWVLGALYGAARDSSHKLSQFWIQYAVLGFSKMSRYVPTHFSQVNQYLSGTMYVGSQVVEVSPGYILDGKLDRLVRRESIRFGRGDRSVINTGDAARTALADESIDYLFIDPPFGANLMYSELNFLWEAWLKVRTNSGPEAIESKAQGKDGDAYRRLMTACFREAYRVLKPGRWMTVEFSNTSAVVWNSIQSALADAGFLVANVSALDKQQLSFKAVTTTSAVKQDLVISAYKPNGGFEARFAAQGQSEAGAWDFVRTHLGYLPVLRRSGGAWRVAAERDARLLYDQLVAYYVRRGHPVPLSSGEFQVGLAQRFLERDGRFYLPEQASEYDRRILQGAELGQESLFISDEASAIQWLRAALAEKPQTTADLTPQFMQQLAGWSKAEAHLELGELLAQNFLCYDGADALPGSIHAYLSSNWHELRGKPKDDPALLAKARDRWYMPDPNRAADLERLRERALLKEFDETAAGVKKLKVFRIEAVRAGFKRAWQARRYDVIVAVAERLPYDVLESDPHLLMWYDNAQVRVEQAAPGAGG